MPLKQWIKRQVKKVIGYRPPSPPPASPRPDEPLPPARVGASNHRGEGPHTTADVVKHYETLAPVYRETYGEIYQAARAFNIDELLARELESAQLEDGQRVLDAGCGVCGPAIWFAKHKQITVDAVTISPAQLDTGTEDVAKANLSSRIKVHLGDYHKMEELFPLDTFDRVYFLESLCHAESYRRVLASTWKVLKPGGCIYIKDYVEKDFSFDPAMQKRADVFLKRSYAEYSYSLVQRSEMISMLAEAGFKIEFMENCPFTRETEDLSVQVGFEQKAGFHWRDGLDLWLAESVEIRARKLV